MGNSRESPPTRLFFILTVNEIKNGRRYGIGQRVGRDSLPRRILVDRELPRYRGKNATHRAGLRVMNPYYLRNDQRGDRRPNGHQ